MNIMYYLRFVNSVIVIPDDLQHSKLLVNIINIIKLIN
jgi:hypothetical protein